MNKSFKSIWNESLGAWVAASEITCGRGKRSKSSAAVVVVSAVLLAGGVMEGAHGQGVSIGEARAVADEKGFAAGRDAAAGNGGVSVGFQALSNGADGGVKNATAIGSNSNAESDNSIAIGAGAIAQGSTATAAGGGPSIAIGAGTRANGNNNIAFGTASTKSLGENSIAIGDGALAESTARQSIAIGIRANVASINTIAIGYIANARGESAVAIGYSSESAGDRAAALGVGAMASGDFGTALGRLAKAIGKGSTALGSNEADNGGAIAEGANSIAIGGLSNVTVAAISGIAIGKGAKVTGAFGMAQGQEALASADNSTAVGAGSAARGAQSSVFGVSATANQQFGSALGSQAWASGKNSTAVGTRANALADSSTAVGVLAQASLEGASAFGISANATGKFSSALGFNANAAGENAVAVGFAEASGNSAIAVGPKARATVFAIALGPAAQANSSSSIAIGAETKAFALGATALGTNANGGAAANAVDSIAIGGQSSVASKGSSGIAIGRGATVSDTLGIAQGDGATAANSAVALGASSRAIDTAAVAIGSGANALGNSALAFGVGSHSSTVASVAIGSKANATGSAAVALGAESVATGNSSVALGFASVADRDVAVSVGSAAFQRQIVNVAAGTVATDAVNVGQLNEAFRDIKVKGSTSFTAAVAGSSGDVAIGPTANASSGTASDHAGVAIGWGATMKGNRGVAVGMRASATGDDTAAYGYNANASATNSTALGSGATASQAGSVALGQGSVADRANVVSVGTAAAQRQIVNVAAGTADTDAVNVSQLNAVNVVANKGWNLSANGEASPFNIAPGGKVDFIDGSNTTVSRTNNQIKVDVSKTPTFQTVTATSGTPGGGRATLGSNGLTTITAGNKNGPSVTSAGIDAGGKPITNVGTGTDDSDAATVKQVKAVGDNALQYDPKGGQPGKESLTLGGLKADGTPAADPVKLGNVADGKVAVGSKDAVNGGQLNAVSELANKGWNLSANAEASPFNIAPGGKVDFVDGSNTTVSRTNNQIKVDVSKTPVFDSVTVGSGVAGTPGTGSATLGANGLTMVGTDGKAGPSVTAAGIDAGGKALSNVGAGTKDTDAANVKQINAVGAKADNALQYDPKGGQPGKESLTLGGLKADGTPAADPVKLGNVADGKVAAGSRDAVNGGQLNTVSELANKGWNLSANSEASPFNIAPGGKVDFVNGSNTTVSRTSNQIKVDVSKTPVFESVTVGTGVAGTPGTGSATLGANGLTTVGTDGKAGPSVTAAGIDAGGKALANVGPGTKDTDAATVGQVKLAQTQAGNSMQYDGTDRSAATLGGTASKDGGKTGGTKLSNVAQGALNDKSTDAVNGAQLNATNTNANAALGGGADVATGKAPTYAVAGGSFDNVGSALGALDEVASKGWNLSANSADALKIAPGGVVDFINGSNTTVSRDGSKIKVDVSKTPVFDSVTVGTGKAGEPGTGSATLGANGLTTVGTDGKAGPSVTAAGIDAGGKALTNVGAGTKDTDAANVKQMNAVGAKADNALQYDPKDGNPGKDSLTLGGLKADGTPVTAAGVKLGNVADGNVAAGSKDAVNGGQLNTVSEIANRGWNLSANGEKTPQNIAPGGVVDFINGSNTTVSRINNQIKVDVSKTPVFESVTVGSGVAGTPGTGSATLGANGLTTVGTDGKAGPSVTAAGIDAGGKALANVGAGTKDTDAANVQQVNAVGAKANNALQYDPKDGKPGKDSLTLGGLNPDGTPAVPAGVKLGNVADGNVAAGSKDAVNGGQLNTVSEIANRGWNLSANGEKTPQNIAPGGVVDFVNGSNTTVSRINNQIKVDVSKTPVFESVTVGSGVAGTPGTGSATLGANGLTTVGTDGKAGPSVTAAGIDAGGKALANVGPGTNDTDAANVGQVKLAQAQAGNALQYDPKDGKPGKDSLTLGGLNADGTPAVPAGVKLGNVADGNVAAGSKDAVNGGQLNAVSEIANKGWNLSANGEASPFNIAPGGKVDFVNGSNTTVSRTNNQIKVDVSKTPVFDSVTVGTGVAGTPGTGSATLGANGLTTVGKDGTAGPSVTAVGIDAGGKALANVGAGTKDTDAANVQQVNAVGAKANNALQYDPKDGKPGKESLTLGGLKADGTPATAPVKLGNVADGNVAAGSKDAVNGGQLNAVSEIANKGWNLSANGEASPFNIAPGGKVDFVNGSNTTVSRSNDNQIKVDVSKTPVFDSVTVGTGVTGTPGTGSTTLGANGLTTVGTDGKAGPSVTATDGINAGGKKLTGVGAGTDETDAANVKQMNEVGAKANNALQYDPKDGQPGKDSLTLGGLNPDGTPAVAAGVKLRNVADGNLAAGSKDAVNGGQLNAVSEIANKGWNLSANSVDALKIAPGGVVDFVNGSNTTVSRDGSKIKVDVSKTPVFDSVTVGTGKAGEPGTGSTTLGANGLTTVGKDGTAGPSVTADGIQAGGKKLAGVGRGTEKDDAANVEQMNEVGAKADNALQYDPKDGQPGKDSLTLGGLKADGTPATAPVKLGNVADGKVAADSKDAVNGGQLNTLGTGLSNVLGGTYAGGVYTPPTYVTVGGGTATTVQGALDNLGNAMSSGSVGPVQRTGSDGQLALVAPGASGAAPGAAQQLTNVKAGTVSGTSSDAVNGSQLHATNEAVAAAGAKADNALQYDAKDGKPGRDSLTLGGLNAEGKAATAPVKLGNVADGNLAAGSKDAVNGGQLFTTNQNVTNLGNDLKNLSTNIDDGKVGPLQRSDTADALVLVGKGATAAAPGAAQRVSNVANGTGAGDAVNFGQLTDVAKTANNSLQYDNADKSAMTMGGTKSNDGGKTGGTKVTNVAQGALNDTSTDAVNGAQLHAANTAASKALGGGANLNEGKAPSYTVQGKSHDNVGGALGSVNENLTTVNNALNGGGIKYFRANSTLPDAVASGTDAVAVGPNAKAGEAASVAVGSGAKASAVNGTAVGFNAVVQQAGGVALGSGSVASTAAGVAGHVPAGASAEQAAGVRATTSTQAAVSVGDAASGQYRQITGVAAGSADSDAANVAQLKASASAAKAGSAQYDTHPDGSTNYGQMTLGNGQAPDGTRIGNVAPGVLPTDAANVGQLNQVKNQLQRQLGDVARVAYSGTAMALAMSGTSLPPMAAGEKAVGVGFGNYKGYSALALTFKALSEDGQMSWGAGVSSTGREWGVNAGIGWKWR